MPITQLRIISVIRPILKSEKLDKSYELAEMLKDLTINYAAYYVSYAANANDAKGDPEKKSQPAIHTSDGRVVPYPDYNIISVFTW